MNSRTSVTTARAAIPTASQARLLRVTIASGRMPARLTMPMKAQCGEVPIQPRNSIGPFTNSTIEVIQARSENNSAARVTRPIVFKSVLSRATSTRVAGLPVIAAQALSSKAWPGSSAIARSEIGMRRPSSQTASQTPRDTVHSVLSSQMLVAAHSDCMMSARWP